tara:strand:- start:5297 stop:6055 length:759 start_codon:yes stop_codon:yes gene_type:complete
MARQFLDEDFMVEDEGNLFPFSDTMVKAEEPANDWGNILKFVGKRTPSYWRQNPIALNGKAPMSMKEIMNILPTQWRHGDKGGHNNPANKDFVMCGVGSCQVCEAHIKWATNNPKQVSLPALQEIKHLFDEHSALLMIAPAELDVWLTGSVEETRASIKAQVELIKAKEFNPTVEEFKTIYESLNSNDLDTPAMMMVLNKWLAKKGDDLPEFLELLTGKKEPKTDTFIEAIENIEENETQVYDKEGDENNEE